MDKNTNDAAGKVGEVASNLAKDAINSGSEYYREGSRAIATTVQEQPLGSLLVASAVGFMLALVLNRPPRQRGFREYYNPQRRRFRDDYDR